MELCQKLSYLRVELSMSQFTVAEALHVSRQAISQWERGEVLPSLENLIHLSKLYQISLDELLNNRAEPPFQPPITRPLPQKPAEPEKVEPEKVEPEAVEPAPEPPDAPEAAVPETAAPALADVRGHFRLWVRRVLLILLGVGIGFALGFWVCRAVIPDDGVEVMQIDNMHGEEVDISQAKGFDLK